ncbi:RHS repeat domain-containing protein, partial [Citrobacter farmeri]
MSWPKEPVPAVRVYRWDSAGRIIRVEHNDSSGIREEEFRYDACGNLFDSKPCQASRTEEYRNTYYRYDEFGRLSRKWNASLEQRFEYDADSRLVKVENVRGTVYTQVEMEYDLLGRRTLKRARHRWTNATEETQFGWTGLRLYGEKQPGCPEVLYSYEEGSYAPLARMVGRGETTKIQWFRNGLNGCPEALTDADGELKWRQHQTALWGKMPYEDLTDGQGVMQNLRFQGQYLDRETGLHYNLFR